MYNPSNIKDSKTKFEEYLDKELKDFYSATDNSKSSEFKLDYYFSNFNISLTEMEEVLEKYKKKWIVTCCHLYEKTIIKMKPKQ
jgi:hypothetical protein